MVTRRTLLALAAGTTLVAGCRSPGGGSGGSLSVETSGATVVPGETATIDVQASLVGVLTWRLGDVPESWQITYENFEPQPTAVRESYPPQLVWDPAVDSVRGQLSVAVPPTAAPGTYALPVEAGSETTDERVVSEAIITVESAGTPTTDPSG
ncbi:hypothetical protein [Haloarcula salina]|uniref:Uncharacterized protein n=1 Tax=Haloarcula salina TaxID=1429914 RepID=A0AA41G035_9EURY|nr:hypothetical protein [Haloarcula salina]MBV0901791.1 hypothetical protein [Haloarcula salina]